MIYQYNHLYMIEILFICLAIVYLGVFICIGYDIYKIIKHKLK